MIKKLGCLLVVGALLELGLGVATAAPKKGKTKEVVHWAACFEKSLEAEKVDFAYATGTAVDGGKGRKGKVLEVKLQKGAKWSEVNLQNTPADIRKIRSLRFWLKADGEESHQIVVRIYDKKREDLEYSIKAPSSEWTQYELRLGDLPATREFSPTHVVGVVFIWFPPVASRTVYFDDVQLIEGEGGWRLPEEEQAARIFGEKRVKKVKKKKTKHFTIWMDTKSAAKKFPKALEDAYTRVRAMLDLKEMEGRLPVYIFQNPGGYWKFCERHLGWPLTAAQASAGHGSARYFATYFQGNKAPTVTHELTHAMVHRTLGWGGGSWFQEGAAVYCEELDYGKSAAREFSPIVRGGRHVPLREFMAMERLIDSEDKSGGSRTADSLYAQAGALFEFLLRCPSTRGSDDPAARAKPGVPAFSKRMRAVAALIEEGDAMVEAVEKIYEAPIEDLEKAWIAWGSEPPKPATY